MKKMINDVRFQGYLYDHKLESKVSGPNSKAPGTSFISGTVDIATDADMTNVVSVRFSYMTPTYSKSGKPNRNYTVLSDIISGKVKNVMADGAEHAAKVSVQGTVGLNEFYTNRNGAEELVSVKRNEGSFISVINAIDSNPRQSNGFDVDIVLNGTRHIEADDERGLPEKLVLKGCIFDFRGAMMPVEFSVVKPGAIDYFESQLAPSANNPVFTHVRGTQVSETVVSKIEEENAFGEPYVREVVRSRKDWIVDWAAAETYTWDDETSITVAELNDAIAERNTYLATVKQARDEYLANKDNAISAPAASNASTFNF